MSEYLERARELRAITEIHYNCAQSVAIPFAKVCCLDENTLFRMCSNFGGGMKMGSVCGALTGSLMVLGLCGLDDVPMLHDIYDRMKERHNGCMLCKDLLRMNAEKGLERKPHCDAMVYEFVSLTEDLLRQYGKIQ